MLFSIVVWPHIFHTSSGVIVFLPCLKTHSEVVENISLLVFSLYTLCSILIARQSQEIHFDSNRIDVAIQRFNLVVYHDQKADLGSDLLLTVGFHLAHIESEQKSERIKATFEKKRQREAQGGERRTSICPAWMVLSDCKTKFELIPEYSALLQRIFRMRIDDNLGSSRVVKLLNSENIKNFNGRPWSTALIEKYWKMEQAIGVFQPTTDDYSTNVRRKIPLGGPILDYYPAAITKQDFATVQLSFSKYEKGTKSVNYKNLFAGMLKCSICGGTLSYSKVTRGQPKLRCRNYLDSRGCVQGSFGSLNYIPVEQLLINAFSKVSELRLCESDKRKSTKIQLKEVILQINRQEDKVLSLKGKLKTVSNKRTIYTLAEQLDSTYEDLDSCKQNQASLMRLLSDPNDLDTGTLKLNSVESRRKYNSLIHDIVDYIVVSENDCTVVFNGSLGTAQLFLHDRYNKYREYGYLIGKDVINEKFISKDDANEHKEFEININTLMKVRSDSFRKLTNLEIPPYLDYLKSIKFVFKSIQGKGFPMVELVSKNLFYNSMLVKDVINKIERIN